MLKIPENKKFRHLPDYMKVHLLLISPQNTKVVVIGYCFILLDFCLIPLLTPINTIINIATIPFLLFINLWAIRLLVKNPYTTQMETILFLGVTSFIGAISYLITSMKVSYLFFGITSIWYFLVLSLVYFTVISIAINFQIKKFSSINDSLDESKKWYNNKNFLSLITVGPGIGYILFFATKKNELFMHTLFLIACIGLTILFSYISTKYIHKYMFMKVNNHLLIIQKPSDKKKRKAYENKGVVYK
ncbi:hypothetical protein [Guptibacillus spartinae]|uniref:hypothetical protein n=1 Tax=Guptibacillus spartinae TaxID=3025679 RepID=UPI0023627B03|nr:hypothetical protein [Pseudalkalibacillus spartinae]